VWVPGCSTGEEAYTIAIMLREHQPKGHSVPRIQIFASDIDEAALEIARIGRYPASITKNIPSQRLQRYFVREDGTYRIASDLREICLFSSHNLLRDAPFSKLDLISCRNLLIYLNSDLQNRVIPLFHYALRDDGFLLLGTSENVTRHSRLFSTIDKPNRIFKRRTLLERRLPEFPLTTPDSNLPRPAPTARPTMPEGSMQGRVERLILDKYAPAYVVINGDGEVLQSSGRTGKYLELPAGAPDNNIFSMSRQGLRMDLRAALHKASSLAQPVSHNKISVGTNGGRQVIDLVVHPLANEAEKLYLVVFQDVGGIKAGNEQQQESTQDVTNATLHQLESELRSTKERLQTTTEELESSNEELKSGNEELSSINEELQSSNEELETSREELQSMNEELQTVNSELNARVEELSRANSDMANLLESTQIATLFLDRNLAVKSFTPATKDLFRLVESDAGRPIMHVRARFEGDTVQEDAERVLRTLTTVERQVHSNETEARYIMRIMPYRTVDNVISGVVITFTDVTQIAAAEARINQLSLDLRNRVESLETLLDIVPVGILAVEAHGGQSAQVNRYGARLMGIESERGGLQPVSPNLRVFQGNDEVPQAQQPLAQSALTGMSIPSFEGRLVRNDGNSIDVMMAAAPLFDVDGRPRGAIAAITDITQRKQAEAYQQMLMHELQHRAKNIIATISALASRMLRTSTTVDDFNKGFLTRLTAMGHMHDLLSQHNWAGAELRTLVESALSSFVSPHQEAVKIGGPAIVIKPNAAATLGMVFHELATNAAKYGALSSPDGYIDVRWDVAPGQGENVITITWSERNGPRIKPPENTGFGTGFVQRSIEYELEGQVDLSYAADGLKCTISFPAKFRVEGA
jgi:two-component system CheB/CheR fusion protein